MWHVIRASFLSLALYQNTVAAQANITEDSFFYGESPPVYPSRNDIKSPHLLKLRR